MNKFIYFVPVRLLWHLPHCSLVGSVHVFAVQIKGSVCLLQGEEGEGVTLRYYYYHPTLIRYN